MFVQSSEIFVPFDPKSSDEGWYLMDDEIPNVHTFNYKMPMALKFRYGSEEVVLHSRFFANLDARGRKFGYYSPSILIEDQVSKCRQMVLRLFEDSKTIDGIMAQWTDEEREKNIMFYLKDKRNWGIGRFDVAMSKGPLSRVPFYRKAYEELRWDVTDNFDGGFALEMSSCVKTLHYPLLFRFDVDVLKQLHMDTVHHKMRVMKMVARRVTLRSISKRKLQQSDREELADLVLGRR